MSKIETKKCQNCKKEFTIEPEDFDFYEKIKVPSPTFCFNCRLQRRLAFKNERTLYKRLCDFCKKEIISLFPESVPFPVYCPSCWFSDKWDAEDYGIDYDCSKNFFVQFAELRNRVPKISLYIDYPRTVGGTYMNLTGPAKNCYLVFLAEDDENCLYSYSLFYSKDTADCTKVLNSTRCYELVNCHDCYQTIFSVDCRNCLDVSFSKNLNGCSECFGCVNLTNKKYHIFNKAYLKEEYRKIVGEYNFSSYKSISEFKQKSRDFWLKFPVKYMHGRNNKDVSGDYIYQSKNVKHSFEIIGGVDNKYCHVLNMKPTSNCYDYGDWGNNATLMYECVNCGENIANTRFSYGTWIGMDMEYTDVVIDSKYIFGGICLRKKQYYILNKRYPEEEYFALRERIIDDMNKNPYVDKQGRIYKYGEFFPAELSHYPYKDTAAFDFFPLSDREIKENNYVWREAEPRSYKISLKTEDIPDDIKKVSDSIVDEVIECAHKGSCNEKCTTAFKIIPQELAFYRMMNLPLPRLCHNCRHYERFHLINPPKLWHRRCDCAGSSSKNEIYKNSILHFHGTNSCPNEFETTYASERKEIVYCEKCYLAEVV